jgi:heterodisulfide reductase subunit B
VEGGLKMALKYALYPGCIISGRFPHLEKAARISSERLGIQLVDMQNLTCCPEPFGIQSMDRLTHLSIAARNIAVGESMKLDIMVLCNGCLSTLWHTNTILNADYKLKNMVNNILKEVNRKYKGEVEVKHFYQILVDEVGVEKIKEKVVKPLRGVKVAVHYGCHLLDPAFSTKLDEINEPRGFENLVEAIGAQNVIYDKKYICCGGPIREINDKISRAVLVEKLEAVKEAGADCLTVFCPLCYTQYDFGQLLEQRKTGKEYNIPVLYYPELLALALGYSKEQIGLHEHSITKGLDKIAT